MFSDNAMVRDAPLDNSASAAKLLIVDDKTANVELLELLLERAGYSNVFSTTDSRTVLTLHVEHRFDLILLDIRMPYLDGFQVMDQLSAAISNDYLPVLAITAQTEKEVQFRAIEKGAKDFVTKPFDHEEVLNRIKNLLEIRVLHNQLSNHNKLLEERVAERTRELQRAKAAAESASNAKSIFLANMSHELRTPLNAIIGFSEVIIEKASAPDADIPHLDYVEFINQSGRRLLKVINDVLDLVEIDQDYVELEETELDLGDLVAAAHSLASSQGKHSVVSFEVRVAPELPLVYGDPEKLKQVVLCLLSNAVKFSPDGGVVTIEALLNPNGGVSISVCDVGIGIREEDIALALTPFGQVERGAAKRFDGTGLGLPLAAKFTELHGGVIKIESVPGKGTCVEIILPESRSIKNPPE